MRARAVRCGAALLLLAIPLLLSACGVLPGLAAKAVTVGGVTLERDAKTADLTDYPLTAADYEAIAAELPGCVIRWSVPLGGRTYPSDSETLTVPDFSSDDLNSLAYFPNLTQLDASGSADYAALREAALRCPACAVVWTVPLGLTRIKSDARALDLSAPAAGAGYDALMHALPGLPALETADLRGVGLTDAQKAALMDAFPNVKFSWTVELLPDVLVTGGQTRLDLSGRAVEDAAAFSNKLKLLPDVRYVDMCGCGLGNAQMEQLMAAHPAVRFVWLVRVGGYTLRTDARAFSMGQRKPLPGVELTGGFNYYGVKNEDVANLRYCTDLVALDIGHCKRVSDVSWLAGLTKLQYLVIAIARIEDISALSNLTELRYLECFNNRITDYSPLRNLDQLEYLNCGMNPGTEITPFLGLTNLKRLWLNRVDLTDAQLAELRSALPDTRVYSVRGADPSESWRKRNEGYIEMQKLFCLKALGQ